MIDDSVSGAQPAPGAPARAPLSATRLTAAVVCLLQGAVLLGFCGFYLYELVLGEGDDAGRVVMSVVLMLIVAVTLLAAGRAWIAGGSWPRSPTILWNLLLLPVAWSMWQGGFWGAWPVGLGAVAGIAAAAASKTPREDSV